MCSDFQVVLLDIAGVVWEALTVSQATPGPVANPGPPMLSEVPATMGQEWIQRQRAWRQGPSLKTRCGLQSSYHGPGQFCGSVGVTR